MNTEYRRENHKSYLIVKNKEPDKQSYALKMLCGNPVKGLLPMAIHIFNGEEELCYDISTKQPLSILYEKKEMEKDDLEVLFREMRNTLKNLEEYLLDMECLILEADHIYINTGDKKVYLLYYPDRGDNFEEKAYEFAEYILSRVCNQDEKAVMYAYNFYRYIKEEKGDLTEAFARLELDEGGLKGQNGNKNAEKEKEGEAVFLEEDNNPGFYLDEETFGDVDVSSELKGPIGGKGAKKINNPEEQRQYESLMGITFFIMLGLGGIGLLVYSVWKYDLTWQNLFFESESVAGAGICAMAMGGFILFKMAEYLRNKKSGDSTEEKKQEFIKEGSHALEEIVFEEADENEIISNVEEINDKDFETVLLQENSYCEQRILTGRIRGRRKEIDLSSFPFIVGKSREQADYVLEDSSISRIHARFTLREDVVYLTDLNSTNGTSKNGIRLEPNELTMLEADDEITFGRLTFTYH